ncbi:MAG: hypothetical protein AB1608_08865 [Thermoproteota archaeon]
MKIQLMLMALLVVSFLAVADAQSAGSDEMDPQDQPNFEPKVTQDIIDGKNVEIVEFKCKLK